MFTSGNNKLISTSKIKNNTTKIKKRVLKGDRIFLKGSNPHSNGVNFSFSFSSGKFVSKNTNTRSNLKTNENEMFINILVYSLSGFFSHP